MLRKILILTLFVSIHLKSFACQCDFIEDLPETQREDFVNSDLVFVAEVIKVYESEESESKGWYDKVMFELRVTENFKGTKREAIIKGAVLTSCDISPIENETWLIYGNRNNDGLISISSCGLSRSILRPERILYKNYIPQPPPKDYKQKPNFMFDTAILLAEIRLQAAKDLKEEIQWLRTRK